MEMEMEMGMELELGMAVERHCLFHTVEVGPKEASLIA